MCGALVICVCLRKNFSIFFLVCHKICFMHATCDKFSCVGCDDCYPQKNCVRSITSTISNNVFHLYWLNDLLCNTPVPSDPLKNKFFSCEHCNIMNQCFVNLILEDNILRVQLYVLRVVFLIS